MLPGLNDFRERGINIVIVSHDLGSLETLCNRMIWIERGVAKAIGAPQDVLAAYLASAHNPAN